MLTIRNDFNSIIESKVLRDSAATFSVNGNELKKTRKNNKS